MQLAGVFSVKKAVEKKSCDEKTIRRETSCDFGGSLEVWLRLKNMILKQGL